MAAPFPTLQTVSAVSGTAVNTAIANTLGSPVAGDVRVIVISLYNKSGLNNVNVTPPAGWIFAYVSPVSSGGSRSWVYYKRWLSTDPATVTWSWGVSVPFTAQVIRVSGYNLATNGPIVAVPRGQCVVGNVSQLTALGIIAQAEALRVDFWAAYYGSAANTTATITPPVGQTVSPVTRPSLAAGYVSRVSYENTAGFGYTGNRVATMTPSPNAIATSVIIGGWKVLSRASTTAIGSTASAKGTKKVTRQTAAPLALSQLLTDGSGRHSTGTSSTVLAVSQASRRVFLTRTAMALTKTSTGTHHGTGVSDGGLDVADDIVGTHTAQPVQTEGRLNVRGQAAGRIGGGGEKPSYVDQYIQQYIPSDKPLRFLFQDIRTSQWLNWDVPIVDPEITFTLQGAAMIRGKIGPEDADAVANIDAWSTWVHCEEGGVIRASGILQPIAVQDSDLVVEAVGVMGYPVGQPFTGEYSKILIDPADVVRFLWLDHLQGFVDGFLHVTLDDTHTPARLGDDEIVTAKLNSDGTPQYVDATIYDGTTDRIYVDQASFPIHAWDQLTEWGYQTFEDTSKNNAIVRLVYPPDYAWATVQLPAQIEESTTDNGDGTTTVTDKWQVPAFDFTPQKPYELSWWNEVDVGNEIANLAKQTPFDLSESAAWTADRLGVDHHINIGYPRLGARRPDLRFVEDENILAAVLLREQPDFYASQVLIRGAGEGRDAIRAEAGVPSSRRVRRYKSLADKTIVDQGRAQAVANDEYNRRLALLTITEITVDATHDNAPMGSFQEGDDIYIQANIPYFGDVGLWHRITSYTWHPDVDEVVIQCRRSENFSYGRVTSDTNN